MRIKDKEIPKYIELYDRYYSYGGTELKRIEVETKEWLKHHDYLTKETFLRIGRWKTKRQSSNYNKNDSDLIKEISKISFSTEHERLRIGVLTLLNGVSYPVASAILHFKFPESYPIIDFRAIYSLGWDKPHFYKFDYWWNYVTEVREQSKRLGISMRDIDKALWAYSKKNQEKERSL